MKQRKGRLVDRKACPDDCAGGNIGRVRRATFALAGLNDEAIQAAKLTSDVDLYKCMYCGCVWRKTFNPDFLQHETCILGHNDAVFVPAPWLKKAIAELRQGDREKKPAP